MAASLSEAARQFLSDKRFAVLATINRDGTPQQSVVWYDLRDGVILMNTRRGRLKDRNLRRNPRCSICIDDGYRYLTIRGSVTLSDDQVVAQADIARLATRYHGPKRSEEQMRDQFSREERVTIWLHPERVDEYGF
jgi:PPOX class probable F420-dependent enzyme